MTTKKKYQSPEIELVELDNQISLSLQSVPPDGPEEGDYFEGRISTLQDDPYKLT
jgi:hypothetical protein